MFPSRELRRISIPTRSGMPHRYKTMGTLDDQFQDLITHFFLHPISKNNPVSLSEGNVSSGPAYNSTIRHSSSYIQSIDFLRIVAATFSQVLCQDRNFRA